MRFGTWSRALCACGLVMGAALSAVGVATTAPTVAATTDDARAAAAELIGFVPEDVRYQCTIEQNPLPASVKTLPGTIRVSLLCPGTDGVDVVRYYLFAENGPMNDVYAQAVGVSGSQPVRSEDGKCPGDGTWDFGEQQAGKVACYYTTTASDSTTGELSPEPEYTVKVWTYDAENILAVAAMPSGNTDAATLEQWWNDKAGPTKTASTVSGVVASDSGTAQYKRALLTHVPAVTRKHCTPIDTTDPTATDFYIRRLWIRAAVVCPTTAGADHVIYESFAPNVVAPFFVTFTDRAVAQKSSMQTDTDCPDSGTYASGAGKKSHTVGKYACVVDVKDGSNDDAPYADLSWSYPKLGIVAYAVNDSNDADALNAWFQSTRSGPN